MNQLPPLPHPPQGMQLPPCAVCGKSFTNQQSLMSGTNIVYQATFWGFACQINTHIACRECLEAGKIFLTPATDELLDLINFDQLPLNLVGVLENPSFLLSEEAIQREIQVQITGVQRTLQNLFLRYTAWEKQQKNQTPAE